MISGGVVSKWTARLLLNLALWVNAAPLVLLVAAPAKCCCRSRMNCCCRNQAKGRGFYGPRCRAVCGFTLAALDRSFPGKPVAAPAPPAGREHRAGTFDRPQHSLKRDAQFERPPPSFHRG